MTVEEKLRHFTTVTLEDVHEKCERSLNEYKEMLDRQFEQHKDEAVRASELRAKTLTDGIERNASKEYTMEQLHIKRKINHKQDELRERLFARIESELVRYRTSPEYKALLVKQINKAKRFARGEEINIYIDGEDEHLKEQLEAECNIKLGITEHGTKGGIRAEIPKKNILIDNTFETKLEESKERFMIAM